MAEAVKPQKVLKALQEIQSSLEVKKTRENKFAKKADGSPLLYRSADDILNQIKPLLKKHNCICTLTDSVSRLEDGSFSDNVVTEGGAVSQHNKIQHGSRIYVEAVCVLTHVDDGSFVSTVGIAREPFKGSKMDESQTTGSASTYARKKALDGMFLLDDGDYDPDSAPKSGVTVKPNKRGSVPSDF